MSKKLPDYYAILGISERASESDIKNAYRRMALEHHPDRNPDNLEQATRDFQFINDAFAVLSNGARRRQYDQDRKHAQLFNPLAAGAEHAGAGYQPASDADHVFSSVFEDLLRPELSATPNQYFWQPIGGISGGAIGFIFANIPGAIAGYAAGSWAGAVRDKKGKALMQVFQDLPPAERSSILATLLKKIMLSAVPK